MGCSAPRHNSDSAESLNSLGLAHNGKFVLLSYMKCFSGKWVMAAALVVFCALSAPGQGRIATVDLRKVFDNYWKTKQADASLKDRAADMEKEFKSMTGDFDKGKEEYRKLQDG